ncbi:MAG: NADH-dependent flavin oxidoreductase, partial [Desulfobacterales bacterium SG8_35_2]
SVENRFRFAREIIQAVRPVVPEDRLITFRISNWGVADPEVSLYETKDEYQQIIRMLSREPIDAISVSTYDFAQKVFGTKENMAQITREVTGLPLMICGRIYDRASADQALEDADIILSAKAILLNPNWVADLEAGKPMEAYTSEEANIAYTEKPLP